MRREDFYIGLEFYTATGRWRCTDVGNRVVVAIQVDRVSVTIADKQGQLQSRVVTDDASWFNGPPYAVVERVFDEYCLDGCSLEAEDFVNQHESV